MNCIVYGLSTMCKYIEKHLKDEHKIIGYSDSFYSEAKFHNKKFYKPEELKNVDFDIIIISIADEAACKMVTKKLINLQIDISKIFYFAEIYNRLCSGVYSYYDKIFKDNKDLLLKANRVVKDNYDGIILGLSHSYMGINPKFLDKKFCNLSLPSQDLYYNLETLKILIKKHSQNIKNLKYVILDLYKYVYFNYDVSLTNRALLYYSWSGFRSDNKHNYDKNKNFKHSIEEELAIQDKLLIHKLDPKNIKKFKKLVDINKIDTVKDLKDINEYDYLFSDIPIEKLRMREINSEDINECKKTFKARSIQTKVFKDTINENISIFNKILSTLTNINPDIKIYTVLIPQHKVVEDLERNIESNFKIEFYKIIDSFKEKYNLTFLDFKNHEEISSRNDYYYDVRHLNYKGSVEFTKLLNSYIEY